MKILVAGGTGFIGSSLCTELVSRGHEVTALSRRPDASAVPEAVAVESGDVTDYDSIASTVASHEAIVNLVALSPLFEPPRGTTHEAVHLDGTENLIRAAEDAGVDRFVQLSALDADPRADTDYLRAKGRAEAVVEAANLEWTIVRPSIVFGDGDEFLGFVRMVTTPYLTGLPGGGTTRFQPIWIGDFVELLAAIPEDDAHVGETYEIGGPEVLTLADVTRLVHRASGRSVRIAPVPMPLAKIGLSALGPVPLVPFGPDQARSLGIDNTVADNDISAFGRSPEDLTTLSAYLSSDVGARSPGAASSTPAPSE
ncbi:complex I NDUFA9 subunit family protein [Halobacteria archaeon AArc-dxtr1]|nr:complex I NDUFA9 subunit family protein [Halobacteria archaeon AArc-dxtr1]